MGNVMAEAVPSVREHESGHGKHAVSNAHRLCGAIGHFENVPEIAANKQTSVFIVGTNLRHDLARGWWDAYLQVGGDYSCMKPCCLEIKDQTGKCISNTDTHNTRTQRTRAHSQFQRLGRQDEEFSIRAQLR